MQTVARLDEDRAELGRVVNPPSNIFMLSPSDFSPGICSVCGQAATIKYRCAATGMCVGDCCRAALVGADALLSAPYIRNFIRHPTLEESKRKARA